MFFRKTELFHISAPHAPIILKMVQSKWVEGSNIYRESFPFINAINLANCFRTTQLFLHNFLANSNLVVLGEPTLLLVY